MSFTKDDEVEIMTNRKKGIRFLESEFIIIVFVGFVIFNLICIEVVPAYQSTHEIKHVLNHNNPLKDLKPLKLPKTSARKYEEFELTIDYTISDIFRAGKTFRRLAIINGGIECGLLGEELPFFKHTLETQGEIESISVEFGDQIEVTAMPTPYLVPQVLGSNLEVLSDDWQGSIKGDISADWTLNHLSKTTSDNNRGELYSLKIYPLEFSADGSARIYKKVKVTYSVPHNYMWLSVSPPDPGHKPTGPVKYLIITHPDLEVALESFTNWKSQKGLFTQVITTEELEKMSPDGDLQFKMRKYVQEMENVYDLDYLLLVGDWDLVPTRNTKNSYCQPMMGETDSFASDLYFACVDPSTTWNKDGDTEYAEESEVDDCIPDLANGRLSINSPTVLSSILNGLINREKNLSWDPDMETAVYMCGDPGYLPGDPTEVMDYFWTEYGDDVFSGRETIYYDDTGSKTFSSNSFEKVMDGAHQAMCYFGHGQPTEFPDLYSNNQINQLMNNGTEGSLFAMACLTGWFDDPAPGQTMGAVENCFAEMLTETPDKGVVGYIGSSRIAVGYIDTTYSDDAPGLEEDYWRAIREASRGNITPTVGNVWRKAITNFASSFYPFQAQGFDNPALRTFLEYNLLGEPDAPLILNKPEALQLDYNLSSDKTSIWSQVTNSTGAPVSDATVTIYRYDELGRASKTNSKGEVTITIPPNNGGIINITASKPGDIPVNYTFSLPDNLAPAPEYEITPREPDGNNNYYISRPVVKLSGDEPVDVQYHLDGGDVIYGESSTTVVVPEGNHTIYFRVVDKENQWSKWLLVNVSVDQTPPELFITTTPPVPDGNSGWFITKPTVILNSNEPLNNSLFSVGSGEETEYDSPHQVNEGVHYYSFTAYDLAGNSNKTHSIIKVDLNAPLSVANVSHPPDGENGYYTTPPNIVLKCLNEPSASLEYRWDSGAWKKYDSPLTPGAGMHTLFYRGVDIAGNSENKHNITFHLDSETPNLGIVVVPSMPDGENGFYSTNPVIDLRVDNMDDDGVYYCLMDADEKFFWSDAVEPLEGAVIVPDGDWTLYAKAVDLAGNVGYLDPVTFKVDTIPPVLSWSLTPSEVNGNSGWHSSRPTIKLTTESPDTKVYWTYHDVESWNEYKNEITLTSGVHKLRFKAVDFAGNVFYNESCLLKVDLESPQITIIQPQADTKVSTTVLVNWHGADDNSGICQYRIRLNSKSWLDLGNETGFEFENLKSGKHTVYISAWDFAGNSKKLKRSFIVDGVAPTIMYRSPRGKNVHVDSKIEITFSEEMRKESVKIYVNGVDGTITWEGNSAIFVPASELEHSTKYNVIVTGTDAFNNSLSSSSWYFITAAAPKPQETSSMPIYVPVILVIIIATIIVAAVAFIIYRKKKEKGHQK